MKKLVEAIVDRLGYKILKKKYLTQEGEIPLDIYHDQKFMALYEQCRPYTMASVERLFSLYQSVKYVVKSSVAGDLVECGVWRGGCSMMMAFALKEANILDKKIYLYDTFEGMPPPTEEDVSIRGYTAEKALSETEKSLEYSVWAYSPEEHVRENLRKTGYPEENIVFVKGKVEDTIPGTIPPKISLLRLDTDWYSSTKHEMEHLYPLLQQKGVLIIDDYGHWEGARQAVDEYFGQHAIHMMLERVDYTCRSGVKY